MATTTSIHHVSSTKWLNVTAGLLSALGMGVFFLVMRAFNLHHILELRFFNIVFIFSAVFYTIKRYKAMHHKEIGYLQGLIEGLKTTLVNVLAFDIFFVVYLLKIDPHFMEYIIKVAPFGNYLNVWMVAGNIFGEGFTSGAIISFMLMQFYKSEKSETI